VKHLAAWSCWWIGLWWLWLLLAGEWNAYEWVAAGAAATAGASALELARSRIGVSAHVPLRWIARARTVPTAVLVDFGVVTWALVRSLVRREVVHGSFRSRALPGDATNAGSRAWLTLIETYRPNAYVVDVDADERRVLVHELVSRRRS
jgi:multisubunit Na+/H+ antiporter MnhE subunit